MIVSSTLSVRSTASPPGQAPTVVSVVASEVYAVSLPVTAVSGVNFYDGAGADPVWHISPGQTQALLTPLLFPAGVRVRAATGVAAVDVFLQMQERGG